MPKELKEKINPIWAIFTGGWILTGITFLILGDKEIGVMWIMVVIGSLFGYCFTFKD